ncbi:MAG: hypothetical protein ACLSHC_06810 [Bilophila wadsworthia]
MDATRLVDAARPASMKPGAIPVTARGGIVDETVPPPPPTRRIRGAVTDNYESETRPAIPCSGFLRKRAAGCCSLPTSRASPARRSHA